MSLRNNDSTINIPVKLTLIQVRKRVGVCRETLIRPAQAILQSPSVSKPTVRTSCPNTPLLPIDGSALDQLHITRWAHLSSYCATHQHYHIPYVVWSASQKVLPISGFPETESFHVGVVITHRRVPIWRAAEVKVDKLLEIRPDDLISINENDLLQIHWEQNIQEQNLVGPDNSLFFLLCAKPRWPLVRNELILEVVCLSEVWDKFLRILLIFQFSGRKRNTHQKRRRKEVFNKPKLDGTLCISKYTQYHN